MNHLNANAPFGIIHLLRSQDFLKTNISYHVTRACTYQGVRNVSFSENVVNVLNGWYLFIPTENIRKPKRQTAADFLSGRYVAHCGICYDLYNLKNVKNNFFISFLKGVIRSFLYKHNVFKVSLGMDVLSKIEYFVAVLRSDETLH